MTFNSNQELIDATRSLARRLEDAGNSNAASTLNEGLRCINGLTDGWGIFMESIQDVLESHSRKLSEGDSTELQNILETVQQIVYR